MKKYIIVTICGSMKYKREMMKISEKLELKKEYVVIQCVYGRTDYNVIEKEILKKIHFEKIRISDAIFVVNVNGYIGKSTRIEIDYAKSLGKEILSLEPLE